MGQCSSVPAWRRLRHGAIRGTVLQLQCNEMSIMTARLMDGFPPRPDTQVTLANWRTSPFNRWAFHHVREILPSADIPHDPANVQELPLRPAGLEDVRVSGVNGEALSLSQVLEATSTDGLVVLHKGAIVLEHYANGMTARSGERAA